MKIKELKQSFFSLSQKGINYNLDNISKAASLCSNPHNNFRSIHVAGTNGKGSTCAYIESVLRHAGYKTGLFTSPQILHFEEQIKIDGKAITEKLWLKVYKDLYTIINNMELSFFESLCLISFEIFSRSKIDYAVIECGMGGKSDSTNIIIPEVSVITKIALDHKEYLGNTLLQIAVEKLGIVKRGVPLVMMQSEDESITREAVKICKMNASELTLVNQFILDNKALAPSLIGEHQIQNAALAVKALSKINNFSHQVLSEGIKKAYLPGRFEIKKMYNRSIVFDAAHNPDAAFVLKKTLLSYFPEKKIIFIIGIMKDKDIDTFLKNILNENWSYYFTRPKTERALDAEALYKAAEKIQSKNINSVPIPKEALKSALKEAAKEDIICITGSFYTLCSILKLK